MAQFKDTEYRALMTPLYHYTSLEAFQAIMQTGKLWASHLAYMNDSSELEYGFQLLTGQIRTQMERADGADRSVLSALLARTDTEPLIAAPTFAICFSDESNLLSQWQAYTPHGRGVAIGFQPGALIERAARAGWHWTSCKYERESQNAWMEAILTRLRREATEHLRTMDPFQAAAKALDDARGDLFACAARVKHPAFSAESEWRLVSPPIDLADKRVKFRPGKTTLVPYVEFDLCDEKCRIPRIAETVVGPTASANHAHIVVGAIQHQAGVKERIVIRSSGIPFREV